MGQAPGLRDHRVRQEGRSHHISGAKASIGVAFSCGECDLLYTPYT